jgi:hypothetical protein
VKKQPPWIVVGLFCLLLGISMIVGKRTWLAVAFAVVFVVAIAVVVLQRMRRGSNGAATGS